MRLLFYIITYLSLSSLICSQTINIHKTNGMTQSFTLSEIDSITFTSAAGGSGGLPCPGMPTVTYMDKTYNTVQIGSQCWLKENLDLGTMIQDNLNSSDNSIIEKYCYNNDLNNCATYGGLYQWNEAMQYVTNEGSQGICPDGWHIPSKTEFVTLSEAVNNHGNALKAIDQGVGAGTGTNTSGFSGLLVGYRGITNNFFGLGEVAQFWSSTENWSNNFAFSMSLPYDVDNIYSNSLGTTIGFSIRCLKN